MVGGSSRRPECSVFIYHVCDQQDDQCHYYVSPLSHEYGGVSGLPPEAIMGELTEGPERITPECFRPNSVFVKFLQWVIAKHAPRCPDLVAEAKRIQDGYVYIIDGRTQTPEGEVPVEDIIGAVKVEGGQLIGFQGAPGYRILTEDGFVQLDGWTHERLVEELVALLE